jgi:hypothetical protein
MSASPTLGKARKGTHRLAPRTLHLGPDIGFDGEDAEAGEASRLGQSR